MDSREPKYHQAGVGEPLVVRYEHVDMWLGHASALFCHTFDFPVIAPNLYMVV